MNDQTLFQESPGTRALISPREYQTLAHDETLRIFEAGTKGVLLRMATGAGKTLVASMIMDTWLRRSHEHRVMVLSYETQLVGQFAQEIKDYIGITPMIEMADQRADEKCRIIVASRASLLRHTSPTEQQMAGLLEFD